MEYINAILLLVIAFILYAMWQGMATLNDNINQGLKAILREIKALKTNKEAL